MSRGFLCHPVHDMKIPSRILIRFLREVHILIFQHRIDTATYTVAPLSLSVVLISSASFLRRRYRKGLRYLGGIHDRKIPPSYTLSSTKFPAGGF